jgi:glucose/arabinose dehydrogenase
MMLFPDQFPCARPSVVILLLVCVLFSANILAEEPQLQFTRISEFKNIVDIANASDGGEQGLLSLAFAPDFKTSGYFYVWYTGNGGGMILSRFKVSDDPDIANPASRETVLIVTQPFSNHNGGRLRFGPDGMLYLGLGDGGGSNDPDENGQDGSTLLGKLIRIDVDPAHGAYAIPGDNPFTGNGSIRNEIWALGLRNP